jgi:hypothetical protein
LKHGCEDNGAVSGVCGGGGCGGVGLLVDGLSAANNTGRGADAGGHGGGTADDEHEVVARVVEIVPHQAAAQLP